ncbi:MAG: CBS domain-containing protein [Candidatus Rokubacteria bacterium]|nr:CBS domain-containing protein [Candidatus Rokubacteria bacterium]
MTVGEIMVKPVVTAAPDTPAGVAWRLLRQARVRHLPVLDRGLLVGIVSDRDLRTAPSEAARLAEIMTRTVFVLSPDASVRRAARLFRERRFGAMPVLDGRELVGIVSVVDVLRVLSE